MREPPRSSAATHLALRAGVVRVGSLCLNHPKLVLKHPCVGCLCTSSGWLKHIEPQRTYTILTLTELARCVVGCLVPYTPCSPELVSTANQHEPHKHRDSKVCRVLMHESGVVQAQRTSSNLHDPHHHRASKVCRVLRH